MTNQLADRVKEIIGSVEYINIATVSADGLPWNTPVYAAHDEQLTFYWSSWSKANHSKNIRNNENTLITLYNSTRKRGDNHQRGVYIQAKAYELKETGEIEQALKYFKGVGNVELKADDFTGDSVKRLYKAVPEKVWLNDLSESQVTNETYKMRVEVPLDKLVVASSSHRRTRRT